MFPLVIRNIQNLLPSNSDNHDLSSTQSISLIAKTAMASVGAAFCLSTLGIPIGLTTATVLGTGFSICYFYGNKNEEHKSIEPILPSKTLNQLESELREKFSLGIRSQQESLEMANQLSSMLSGYSRSEMELLSESAKFWELITDPSFIGQSVKALTPESLGILAKSTLTGMRMERDKMLNLLITYLDVEDELLQKKLDAIAMSGQPGIDEKTFTGKAAQCTQHMIKNLKKNQQQVLGQWQEEKTKFDVLPPRTPRQSFSRQGSQKIAITPKIETPEVRSWKAEELDNFIVEVLLPTKSETCLKQLERMDDQSLKDLIFKLKIDKLNTFWNIEMITLNSRTSIEKRQKRFEVVFTSLSYDTLLQSLEIESFWTIISNTTDGYANSAVKSFSPEQFALLMTYAPVQYMDNLLRLINAFNVPDLESDKLLMRQKLERLKQAFEERKSALDNASYIEDGIKKMLKPLTIT